MTARLLLELRPLCLAKPFAITQTLEQPKIPTAEEARHMRPRRIHDRHHVETLRERARVPADDFGRLGAELADHEICAGAVAAVVGARVDRRLWRDRAGDLRRGAWHQPARSARPVVQG